MLHSKISVSGGQSSRVSVNNVIVISLPKPDLNSIRMQRILATSLDTVYLFLLTGPITDTGNNSVVVITTTDAIEAALSESGIMQSTLNSLVLDLNADSLFLDFDLNTGSLILMFDEYTLIVSIIDLVTRDILANLENAILNSTTSCREIEFIITQDDFNSISSIEGLSNVGINIDNGFVVDILSQPSVAMTGIEVATHEPNLLPASLLKYTFDLHSGICI